jgi:cyclophilin family peptidyl-prolyl cis-trans isomerase
VVVIAILAVVGSVMLSSGDETPSAGPSAASLAPGEVTASPRTPICENLSPPLLNIKTVRSTPYPMTIDKNATYTAEMTTSCGTMLIKLYAKQAPIAVNNFVNLAEDHFYTGLVFHRLDRNLGIIQAGDPGCPTSVNTCGTGGPGYTIKDEPVTAIYGRGTVAMARTSAPDSVGSQFFIVLSDEAKSALASYNTYQIIGTVTSGMEAADAIAAAADAELPTHPIAMDKVTVSTP